MTYCRNPYIYNDGNSINFGDISISNDEIDVLIYELHQINRKKELQERYNNGKQIVIRKEKELEEWLKDFSEND